MTSRKAEAPRGQDIGRNVGRRACDIVAQNRIGLVVFEEARGVNAADATPVRKADVPDPAGLVRSADGLRLDWRALRDRQLHGERAIVGEDLAAVDPFDTIMAADQKCRMARTVDEQIALDSLP